MKLVLATDSYYPVEGGAERQMRLVCGELARRFGWDVVVVARQLGGLPAVASTDGINIVRCGLPTISALTSLQFTLAAARAIHTARPDAVVALQVGSSAAAANLGTRSRGTRPVVVIRLTGGSIAGSEIAVRSRSPVSRAITRHLIATADAVVAPASHLLDEPGRTGDLLSDRGVVIPNGVATSRRVTATSSRADVVWVGRPDPVKGFEDFLALARLLPNLRFVAVGPEENVGIAQENVSYTGWQDGAASVVASATVFVSTSRYEGSPNSALEALALGVPVVAYDIAAYREMALQAEAGVSLIPTFDVDRLARRVSDLVTERRDDPAVQVKATVPSIVDTAANWDRMLRRLASDPARARSTSHPS